MLPGPDYVYQCPNCGHLLTNGSLLSGNTIGARVFSDGKEIAPMLPDFPNLTKCKKCEEIFWLSKLDEIGTYDWGYCENSEWQEADKAEFLEIEDYFNAISQGKAENRDEELLVRQLIWWTYNDRIRDGEDIFNDEQDEALWIDNVQKLKNLLDHSDLNQRIMKAEICRNLGDFKACVNLIQSIDDDGLNWLKELFTIECNKKNRWVIELN